MAEHAADDDLKNVHATQRRQQRAASTAHTAPLRDATASRLGVSTRRDAVTTESTVDRYAFYLFMGTIALGILSMIVLAVTI